MTRFDDHLAIDVRDDLLDRVIEKFEGLVALLRRYVDRLGPEKFSLLLNIAVHGRERDVELSGEGRH